MQVESYRLPVYVGEQIVSDYFSPPLRLFHRVVHGQRLWCLSLDDGAIWCLVRSGQFVYSQDPPGQNNQTEAVSLSLSYSRRIFVLPTKPEPLKEGGPPAICDGSLCVRRRGQNRRTRCKAHCRHDRGIDHDADAGTHRLAQGERVR